jgi:hypothetical protein
MVVREHPGRTPVEPENRFLGFRAGSSNYAIRLEHVSGLADCGPVRKVNGTPPQILGLSEWRGRLLTVLDLPGLLGEPAGQGPMCLIRLSGTMTRTALRVSAPVTFLKAEDHHTDGGFTMVNPSELVSQLETEILAGSTATGS